MNKIESLTPDQEIALKNKLAEWLEIGRSTHACNRPEAEKVIIAMYEKIGKKPPIFFLDAVPASMPIGDWRLQDTG